MRRFQRTVAVLVFGLFVLALLLRPLTHLLTAGFSGGGFDGSALVLGVPGLVVVVATLVAVASSLSRRHNGNEADFGDVLAPKSAQERSGDVDTNETTRPGFHSGQGGTRNRGFEIEDEPPETDVDRHLRYLRTQLGDTAVDSGSVVESQDSGRDAGGHGIDRRNVPATCPQPHCDARWSDRGLLGVRGGWYEVVGDDQVRCENCGAITDCS